MAFFGGQSSTGTGLSKTTVRAASSGPVSFPTGNVPQVFGGIALAHNDRILLKDQVDKRQNGIYDVQITGNQYTLVRSVDANTSREMQPNILVPVSEGVHADQLFQLITDAPIILEQTELEFGFAALYNHSFLPGLTNDDHEHYLNLERANLWLNEKTSTDIAEGDNLYFTAERAIEATKNSKNLVNRIKITESYIVNNLDDYIGCNNLHAQPLIVTLVAANLVENGKRLIIKDENGSAGTHNIILNAVQGNFIDGESSFSLEGAYESLTLICNGVDKWFII